MENETTLIATELVDSNKLDDIRQLRNLGNLTDEVVKYCHNRFDYMLAEAMKYRKTRGFPTKDFSPTIAAVKNDPKLLALVTQFEDNFEEILSINYLVNKKGADIDIKHHRETDKAMFRQICDYCIEKIGNCDRLSEIIYCFAHRNDPWPQKI